jgi:hypothetical protein
MPHLTRLDGRKHDLIDEATGETYELKTDSYDMSKTPNFFIEYYSDLERAKRGGPWQALANNTKYFVYMYPTNNTFFIFETEKLVAMLEHIVQDMMMIRIPNRTWTTCGFKVPRECLVEYAKIYTWENNED